MRTMLKMVPRHGSVFNRSASTLTFVIASGRLLRGFDLRLQNSGGNYMWQGGRWNQPPRGRRQWEDGRWERHGDRYRWREGRWRY